MVDDERPLGQYTQTEIVKEKVKDFPQTPGVYLMKNAGEKIIYVGKAKNLRARVRSYFQDSKDHSPKTRFLVRQIHHIDYILTNTEVEAFLLEASLIKKHRPRYNIRLKDDKAYPYIRVSLSDTYPRLYLARKVKKRRLALLRAVHEWRRRLGHYSLSQYDLPDS